MNDSHEAPIDSSGTKGREAAIRPPGAEVRRPFASQESLRPRQELLQAGRRLVLHGTLAKIGQKSENSRKFWLFTDVLVCGQINGDNFKHKYTVRLRDVYLGRKKHHEGPAAAVAAAGEADELEFTIVGHERSFLLRAASVDERDRWVAAVYQCLEEARLLQSRKSVGRVAQH